MAESMTEMQVLVTGAGGTLGRGICGALEAHGFAVRRLLRGDAESAHGLATSLRGVHTVLHLASSNSADPAQRQSAHLLLPERILDAAPGAGVKRFVQFSSVKAVAGEQSRLPVLADCLPQPASDYGRYKLAAEELLRGHAASAQLQALILRLPMVYGTTAGGNFARLVNAVARGWPLPVAADNQRSVLAAENLQSLVRHLLTNEPDPQPGLHVIHAADPDPTSTATLLQHIGAACDRPPRLIPVGRRWAERLATVPLVGGIVGRLSGSLVLDTSSLARWPDWQPPLDTPTAVQQAARAQLA